MRLDPSRTTPCEPAPATSWRVRFVRRLFLVAGFICLGLALVGIPLPVLPTTPFVILAAICFARSSERCYRWLLANRLFGKYLCDYLQGRGVAWKVRVPVLLLLWSVIVVTVVLVVENVVVRTLLLLVAVAVTTHLVLLKRSRGGRSDEGTDA